jgi:hypothetical protein
VRVADEPSDTSALFTLRRFLCIADKAVGSTVLRGDQRIVATVVLDQKA